MNNWRPVEGYMYPHRVNAFGVLQKYKSGKWQDVKVVFKRGARVWMSGERSTWVMLDRIVWEAFNGPIPEGCVISHKNGAKIDCYLANLELTTHKDLMCRVGKSNRKPVLKVDDDGNVLKIYNSAKQAAADNFLSDSRMRGICCQPKHSHQELYGYRFLYED